MKRVIGHLVDVFIRTTPVWLFLVGICALSGLAVGIVGYALSVLLQQPIDPSIIIIAGCAGIIIGIIGNVLR